MCVAACGDQEYRVRCSVASLMASLPLYNDRSSSCDGRNPSVVPQPGLVDDTVAVTGIARYAAAHRAALRPVLAPPCPRRRSPLPSQCIRSRVGCRCRCLDGP